MLPPLKEISDFVPAGGGPGIDSGCRGIGGSHVGVGGSHVGGGGGKVVIGGCGGNSCGKEVVAK